MEADVGLSRSPRLDTLRPAGVLTAVKPAPGLSRSLPFGSPPAFFANRGELEKPAGKRCTPCGVMTVMVVSLGSSGATSRYPSGRKVLKPEMSWGWFLNRAETLSITPGVSTTPVLKSFMMSRKLL